MTDTVQHGALVDIERTRHVLEPIANKWSVLILNVLCEKPARFNEIMRRLGGITHKALAESLKRLERSGLVEREVLSTQPVAVRYSVTPLAHSLKDPFMAIYLWATAHADEVERAQATYDARAD